MKVGILTYHRVINYGAFMQAYSLSKALEKCLGQRATIELIDYVEKGHIELYSGIFMTAIQNRDWGKINQYIKFWGAQRKLPRTCKKYVGSEAEVCNAISRQKYDIIIVGSDEIWRNPNSIYWLKDITCRFKMSYAASSRILFSKLTEQERNGLREALKGFHYIGVRDLITKREIEHLIGKQVNLNCDPAFLLDVKLDESKRIKSFREKYKIPAQTPIIGIMLDKNEDVIRWVRQSYGANCVIVSLYNASEKADLNIINVSPFEWGQIIKSVDVMITSYFHGVVYSIKSNTNFVAIDLLPYETSKIYDLLRREKLLRHYVEGKQLNGKRERVVEILEYCKKHRKPDFSSVVKNQRKCFSSFKSVLETIVND